LKKLISRIFIGGCAFCFSISLCVFGFGLRINLTDSVPYSLFTSKAFIGDFKPDVFVSFFHTKTGIKHVKRICGLPGDKIEYIDGNVFVAGKNIGKFFERSPKSGTTYTPLEETSVSEGYLFVCGSADESLDSRYKEFGLVHQKDILEELCPVF
jgi:signal peptidase I